MRPFLKQQNEDEKTGSGENIPFITSNSNEKKALFASNISHYLSKVKRVQTSDENKFIPKTLYRSRSPIRFNNSLSACKSVEIEPRKSIERKCESDAQSSESESHLVQIPKSISDQIKRFDFVLKSRKASIDNFKKKMSVEKVGFENEEKAKSKNKMKDVEAKLKDEQILSKSKDVSSRLNKKIENHASEKVEETFNRQKKLGNLKNDAIKKTKSRENEKSPVRENSKNINKSHERTHFQLNSREILKKEKIESVNRNEKLKKPTQNDQKIERPKKLLELVGNTDISENNSSIKVQIKKPGQTINSVMDFSKYKKKSNSHFIKKAELKANQSNTILSDIKLDKSKGDSNNLITKKPIFDVQFSQLSRSSDFARGLSKKADFLSKSSECHFIETKVNKKSNKQSSKNVSEKNNSKNKLKINTKTTDGTLHVSENGRITEEGSNEETNLLSITRHGQTPREILNDSDKLKDESICMSSIELHHLKNMLKDSEIAFGIPGGLIERLHHDIETPTKLNIKENTKVKTEFHSQPNLILPLEQPKFSKSVQTEKDTEEFVDELKKSDQKTEQTQTDQKTLELFNFFSFKKIRKIDEKSCQISKIKPSLDIFSLSIFGRPPKVNNSEKYSSPLNSGIQNFEFPWEEQSQIEDQNIKIRPKYSLLSSQSLLQTAPNRKKSMQERFDNNLSHFVLKENDENFSIKSNFTFQAKKINVNFSKLREFKSFLVLKQLKLSISREPTQKINGKESFLFDENDRKKNFEALLASNSQLGDNLTVSFSECEKLQKQLRQEKDKVVNLVNLIIIFGENNMQSQLEKILGSGN